MRTAAASPVTMAPTIMPITGPISWDDAGAGLADGDGDVKVEEDVDETEEVEVDVGVGVGVSDAVAPGITNGPTAIPASLHSWIYAA